VEDVGSQIFRLIAVVDPSDDKGVDPFKIVLVKLREARWVALCGRYQAPLRSVLLRTLYRRFSGHLRL